jgi:hypothetical protein
MTVLADDSKEPRPATPKDELLTGNGRPRRTVPIAPPRGRAMVDLSAVLVESPNITTDPLALWLEALTSILVDCEAGNGTDRLAGDHKLLGLSDSVRILREEMKNLTDRQCRRNPALQMQS